MAGSRLCSIPECGKRHFGLGYCGAHYSRLRRYGDVSILKRPAPQKNAPACCTIPCCRKRHFAFGLCSAHYTRLRRHGDPLAGNTGLGVPLQWLREHVNHRGDECLTWPFARIPQGGVVTFEGRQTTAASVMCLFVYGPKPTPTHEAAHNCGRAHEACINPQHLRWDTRSGNHMDKHRHGTMPRGEASHFCILTEEQVREIRLRKKPVKAMAKQHGVTTAAIYAVLSRENWAWLD